MTERPLTKRTSIDVFQRRFQPPPGDGPERTIAEIKGAEFEGLDLAQFDHCLDVIEQHSNRLVFITGPAGTGKSTLVRYMQYHFAHADPPEQRRNVAVVAPTAVAAMSAKGETIHSFFGFLHHPPASFIHKIKPHPLRTRLFSALDTLIIDEISMVRADMIDAIDEALRVNIGNDELFGGVQIVMIGDLLQLPPIVETKEEPHLFLPELDAPYPTSFCFSAQCLEGRRDLDKTIFLEHVFRQEESEFIEILHDVRWGRNLREALFRLNEKCANRPKPEKWGGITLVPTHDKAGEINGREMDKIPHPVKSYPAEKSGNFDIKRGLPAPDPLTLKVGAQVMLVKNDPGKKWINGTLGEVVELADESIRIRRFDSEEEFDVGPVQWENYRLAYDENLRRLVCETIGWYKQFPVTLGWAVTIHKAQGATLDSVVVDFTRNPWDFGHAYVALSRCRSMSDLYLERPLQPGDIITEPKVLGWYKKQMQDD